MMTDTHPQTRRDVSHLLGISQATLRTWDRLFRPWLEAAVGRKGDATRKRYTANDVRLFQYAKQRRDAGVTLAQIRRELADNAVDWQVAEAWEAPATAAPGSSALAARVRELELERAGLLAQLAALTEERERLLAERDAAHDAGQAALLQALQQLGLGKGGDSAESTPAKDKEPRDPPSWWRSFQR